MLVTNDRTDFTTLVQREPRHTGLVCITVAGTVRLNLLGRLSLSPIGDFRAQKLFLSGLDQTSTGDEDGSTTRKF